MKLNAVGVTAVDIRASVRFYSLLGFEFPDVGDDETHVEPATPDGAARLMIDAASMARELLGHDPKPANHASFAIEYDSPAEVDDAAAKVRDGGFTVAREPWDAFWGQRYAVVEDPDGYKVDLYAALRA